MGNGMRGIQGTRGIFTRILDNFLENSGECSHFSIPRNTQECSRRMFQEILGNLNFDLFFEILLVFYQILLLDCYETMEKTITEQFF